MAYGHPLVGLSASGAYFGEPVLEVGLKTAID
jgi:hypothetical protein